MNVLPETALHNEEEEGSTCEPVEEEQDGALQLAAKIPPRKFIAKSGALSSLQAGFGVMRLKVDVVGRDAQTDIDW